jgi:hypothetical protein
MGLGSISKSGLVASTSAIETSGTNLSNFSTPRISVYKRYSLYVRSNLNSTRPTDIENASPSPSALPDIPAKFLTP